MRLFLANVHNLSLSDVGELARQRCVPQSNVWEELENHFVLLIFNNLQYPAPAVFAWTFGWGFGWQVWSDLRPLGIIQVGWVNLL
jgi:hypothetical protein